MKPPPFEYVGAASLEEALAALADGGEDAKPIAGGQSLVPALNMRLVRPTLLVDLRHAGLDGIERENGDVRVGATTTQRALERSADCPPLAARGAPPRRPLRDPQPRHGRRALAHADGAGRAPALPRRARRRPWSPTGAEIAAGDFFVTHYLTTLEPGELVVASTWPAAAAASRSRSSPCGRATTRSRWWRSRGDDGRASERSPTGRPRWPRWAPSWPARERSDELAARGRRPGGEARRSAGPRSTPRPHTCGTSPGCSSSARCGEHGRRADRQRPPRARGRRAAAAADRLPAPSARPHRHARRLRARRLRRVHRARSTASPCAAAACSRCRPTAATCETVESLAAAGPLSPLQEAFQRHHALQCGFCTPGILMAADDLLSRGTPSRDEIVDMLSGHLCRCTGYAPIVAAIEEATLARPSVNLAQSLLAACERHPELEAFPGITYGELLPRVRRIAGGLGRRARRARRRRARQPARDGAPLLGRAVGGRRLRAALVAALAEDELDYCVDDCGASLVIRDGDALPDGLRAPGRARPRRRARSRSCSTPRGRPGGRRACRARTAPTGRRAGRRRCSTATCGATARSG